MQWYRLFGSLFAALMAFGPLAIDETTDAKFRYECIGVFVIFVFATEWFLILRPDHRFELAREPTLNSIFERKFSTVKLKKNERLPFRVNIMRPHLSLFGWQMGIVYSFGMRGTDPDYRPVLPKGHGLCWKVFQSGQAGWFEKSAGSQPQGNAFNLTDEERQRSDHICAILSMPLRKKDSGKPFAVLNIDALTAEAADELRQSKDELQNHANREMVDIATLVRLFV